MKWLEIIELRSMGNNLQLIEPELKQLIDQLNIKSKEKAIIVYTRAEIKGDFSIHLFHESKKVEGGGSPLGLNLVAVLKEFGLINHSIWIEQLN